MKKPPRRTQADFTRVGGRRGQAAPGRGLEHAVLIYNHRNESAPSIHFSEQLCTLPPMMGSKPWAKFMCAIRSAGGVTREERCRRADCRMVEGILTLENRQKSHHGTSNWHRKRHLRGRRGTGGKRARARRGGEIGGDLLNRIGVSKGQGSESSLGGPSG